MESEELEQIPWASLLADQAEGVDKRIYMAVGGVGILIVLVLAMKLLGGGAQPVPEAVALAPEVTVAEVVAIETPMVIAEADLRAVAVAEPVAPTRDRLLEVTAEWFVTDWFTRDGSSETIQSVRSMLSSDLSIETLPHEQSDAEVVFVEWAKTVDVEVVEGDVSMVTVAYRSIRQTSEGFVRNPVETVVVAIEASDESLTVVSLPSQP